MSLTYAHNNLTTSLIERSVPYSFSSSLCMVVPHALRAIVLIVVQVCDIHAETGARSISKFVASCHLIAISLIGKYWTRIDTTTYYNPLIYPHPVSAQRIVICDETGRKIPRCQREMANQIIKSLIGKYYSTLHYYFWVEKIFPLSKSVSKITFHIPWAA